MMMMILMMITGGSGARSWLWLSRSVLPLWNTFYGKRIGQTPCSTEHSLSCYINNVIRKFSYAVVAEIW